MFYKDKSQVIAVKSLSLSVHLNPHVSLGNDPGNCCFKCNSKWTLKIPGSCCYELSINWTFKAPGLMRMRAR